MSQPIAISTGNNQHGPKRAGAAFERGLIARASPRRCAVQSPSSVKRYVFRQMQIAPRFRQFAIPQIRSYLKWVEGPGGKKLDRLPDFNYLSKNFTCRKEQTDFVRELN